MTRAKKYIWVTYQKEGIHRYPDAPKGVEFLRHPHRHMFHFKVEIEVFHDDRDIEFIDFKHKLKKYIANTWYDGAYGCCNFGGMSCEMIAEDLLNYFGLCRCSVSEDGEFFGIVEI